MPRSWHAQACASVYKPVWCITLPIFFIFILFYFLTLAECATFWDILYWTVCYTVPPFGTFCIRVCIGRFVLDCIRVYVTPCYLVGHYVLECVLHRATLWDILYWSVVHCVLHRAILLDILYWTVCYTVPSCGTFRIRVFVTPCHHVGHFVLECVLPCATLWDILYQSVCYTVPPCGTFCIGVFYTVCYTVPSCGTFCIGVFYTVCYTIPSCGTFCTGLCVTLCMEVLVPCVWCSTAVLLRDGSSRCWPHSKRLIVCVLYC